MTRFLVINQNMELHDQKYGDLHYLHYMRDLIKLFQVNDDASSFKLVPIPWFINRSF